MIVTMLATFAMLLMMSIAVSYTATIVMTIMLGLIGVCVVRGHFLHRSGPRP